jgi:hypothetical protein
LDVTGIQKNGFASIEAEKNDVWLRNREIVFD